MKQYLAIAAIALACTACGGETASNDRDSASASASGSPAAAESPAVSASVAAAMGGSGAASGPMQGPRPGKWRITTSSLGQPGATLEQCVEAQTSMAEYQGKVQPAGMNCSEQSFQSTGVGGTGRMVCTLRGMTITNEFTFTGDMSTDYTVETVTKFSGGPAATAGAPQEIRGSMHAERLGDC